MRWWPPLNPGPQKTFLQLFTGIQNAFLVLVYGVIPSFQIVPLFFFLKVSSVTQLWLINFLIHFSCAFYTFISSHSSFCFTLCHWFLWQHRGQRLTVLLLALSQLISYLDIVSTAVINVNAHVSFFYVDLYSFKSMLKSGLAGHMTVFIRTGLEQHKSRPGWGILGLWTQDEQTGSTEFPS
jgi:hypothetical protein